MDHIVILDYWTHNSLQMVVVVVVVVSNDMRLAIELPG